MIVNREKCIGCKKCVPYCVMGVITIEEGKAVIDQDECVECSACLKANVCPKNALYMPELGWPRELREQYSNPRAHHPATKMGGRGTEEVKTNDVTGRVKCGEIGLAIEMGRPGVGTCFRDVEKVTMALSPIGIEWESYNPLTLLFDNRTGIFREDVVNEKVLSCILEFVIPVSKLNEVLTKLKAVTPELDTVYSLCFISTYDEDGTLPGLDIVKKLGYTPRPNAKYNIGIGRP